MHTRDARARGEAEQRIYLLNARRESPLYRFAIAFCAIHPVTVKAAA